jgi:hypothetical protein
LPYLFLICKHWQWTIAICVVVLAFVVVVGFPLFSPLHIMKKKRRLTDRRIDLRFDPVRFIAGTLQPSLRLETRQASSRACGASDTTQHWRWFSPLLSWQRTCAWTTTSTTRRSGAARSRPCARWPCGLNSHRCARRGQIDVQLHFLRKYRNPNLTSPRPRLASPRLASPRLGTHAHTHALTHTHTHTHTHTRTRTHTHTYTHKHTHTRANS